MSNNSAIKVVFVLFTSADAKSRDVHERTYSTEPLDINLVVLWCYGLGYRKIW